jgi:hypothetical protein
MSADAAGEAASRDAKRQNRTLFIGAHLRRISNGYCF